MMSNQQNDIECKFLGSQNPIKPFIEQHYISQHIKILFKLANGGHFEFGFQVSRM